MMSRIGLFFCTVLFVSTNLVQAASTFPIYDKLSLQSLNGDGKISIRNEQIASVPYVFYLRQYNNLQELEDEGSILKQRLDLVPPAYQTTSAGRNFVKNLTLGPGETQYLNTDAGNILSDGYYRMVISRGRARGTVNSSLLEQVLSPLILPCVDLLGTAYSAASTGSFNVLEYMMAMAKMHSDLAGMTSLVQAADRTVVLTSFVEELCTNPTGMVDFLLASPDEVITFEDYSDVNVYYHDLLGLAKNHIATDTIIGLSDTATSITGLMIDSLDEYITSRINFTIYGAGLAVGSLLDVGSWIATATVPWIDPPTIDEITFIIQNGEVQSIGTEAIAKMNTSLSTANGKTILNVNCVGSQPLNTADFYWAVHHENGSIERKTGCSTHYEFSQGETVAIDLIVNTTNAAATAYRFIDIPTPKLPMSINATAKETGNSNEFKIALMGTGFTVGQMKEIVYDFGDGQRFVTNTTTHSTPLTLLTHQYTDNNTYTVTIALSTTDGRVAVTNLKINVLSKYKISGGGYHTCALDDNGVACWGGVGFGESNVPILSNPKDIAANGYHSCAIDDTGVKCWGTNWYGEGTVPSLINPARLALGAYHSCALTDNGVICWGYNSSGQTSVPALSNPKTITAGTHHTCALDDSGVVCWGGNQQGQTNVPALANPTEIVAGDLHTCAIDDTGIVCWGNGQTAVPVLSSPTKIAAGGDHTCALDDSGVVCWGNNNYGQVIVPTLSNPIQITAGLNHSCALDDTGIVCWGRNSEGQIIVPFDLSFSGDVNNKKDFNGDNSPDLLLRNYNHGKNQLWYLEGASKIGQANLPTIPDTSWTFEGMADFNGDNKPDLLLRNHNHGANQIWFMEGANKIGQASLPTIPDTSWTFEGAADFNGDNKPDIVLRNHTHGANLIWYMDGATKIGQASLPTIPDTNWYFEGVADFNNDNKPDLVLRNHNHGKNQIWYMDGVSKTGSLNLPTIPDTNWVFQGAVDFNSDSTPDLLMRNYQHGANQIWYMIGANKTGQASLPRIPDLNWRIENR